MYSTKNPDLENIYSAVLGKVLNYLSYGRKTLKEISSKLSSYLKKYELFVEDREGIFMSILDRLRELDMLDDVAVLKDVSSKIELSSKFRNTKVLSKILVKRGLDLESISSVLSSLSPDHDYNCALADYKKKILVLKDPIRVKRYLIGKGYSYDIISRVFDTFPFIN